MSKRKVAGKVNSKSTKKLSWEDMTVTRVKLNAEQAVLSCCAMPTRGESDAGYNYQCAGMWTCPTSAYNQSTPSS